MPFKFFSPKNRKDFYEGQLRDGQDNKGNVLTEKDIAYRQGYIRSVKENNALYAYKNASPEKRAEYKAKKAAYSRNKKH